MRADKLEKDFEIHTTANDFMEIAGDTIGAAVYELTTTGNIGAVGGMAMGMFATEIVAKILHKLKDMEDRED